MDKTAKGINTICTHIGELEDREFRGAVSPLYMSTSYAYEDVDVKRYPRYFNTPNQEALCRKIAALEHTEAALIFGSGMAAVSTSLLAFLQKGDHLVIPRQIYGGTYNLLAEEFGKYGIEYTLIDQSGVSDFENAIQPNTRVCYLETPSNPLLSLTDLEAVANLARSRGIKTMIDNTFASPVNQNPSDFGIDIIIHSATKYMGGHSDICAGAVAGRKEDVDQIFQLAKNLGGSLSPDNALERLQYRTFLAPEMGRGLRAERLPDIHNDDHIGRQSTSPSGGPGTVRLYARVEVVESLSDLRPLQAATTIGIDAVLDEGFPTISRAADFGEAVDGGVGELFGLPGFEPKKVF